MSGFLSDADLARFRSDAATAMPETAEVRRPPTDRTAANWDPATAPATATIACAERGAGQPIAVVVEGRALTITPQYLTVPYDADIRDRDYLSVVGSGNRYQVIGEAGGVSIAHRAQRVILGRRVTS